MASGGQRDIEVESHLGRTVSSETWYFAKAEEAYIVSDEFTNANAGDTSSLTLSNPSDSGTTAVFSPITASVATRSYARVYDNFSSGPSGGSSANLQNVLLGTGGGAPDTGDVLARKNDTFTETARHASEHLGGGMGGTAIGGESIIPVFALEEGRDVVIEVEKLTSGPDDTSITARWFEVPRVFTQSTTDPKISDAY